MPYTLRIVKREFAGYNEKRKLGNTPIRRYFMKATNSSKIRFITRTALGVALVVVAQLIGKLIPSIAVIFGPFSVSQLITGTLVNCVLVVFTLRVGVWSGVVIGILSSILATLLGVGPIVPAVTPLIAAGNALICVAFWLVAVRAKKNVVAASVAGAVVKCAFLWLTVPAVLALVGAPEKQAAMLGIMFSWPQGITALCGGLLGGYIAKLVKRAV